MRKIVQVSMIVCCVAISSTMIIYSMAQTDSDFSGPNLDLEKYELVFSDEFDKMDITASGPYSKWIAHTPWNGDFGAAVFTDPGVNGPFKVEGGKLLIEARKRSDGKWQSGLIASVNKEGVGFKQRYGYWEMRAKLPPERAYGQHSGSMQRSHQDRRRQVLRLMCSNITDIIQSGTKQLSIFGQSLSKTIQTIVDVLYTFQAVIFIPISEHMAWTCHLNGLLSISMASQNGVGRPRPNTVRT